MFIPLASPQLISLATLPPLSLYIHIPWCVRKCPYCDFNSHESQNPIPEGQYVSALVRDLEQALPEIWGRKIHSIFFGGGTPSIFSAEAINELLCATRALLPVDVNAEITLEANPGTVDASKFAAFRAAGINRLSLGIQSFNKDNLRVLGRIHDERQAHAAIENALKVFDNINLDLMYALPGQNLSDALADSKQAISYAPAHISAYYLTLEPNTLFHRHPPAGLPSHDSGAEMQTAIEYALGEAGYDHYETSAFAKKSKHCRHNLNYWQFGDYLGIGAGAHSKISFRDAIQRTARVKHPQAYLEKVSQGAHIETIQRLGREVLGLEFMMNALRLNKGFATSLFAERTGLPLKHVEAKLSAAQAKGLIDWNATHIQPTQLGRRFLNDLLLYF